MTNSWLKRVLINRDCSRTVVRLPTATLVHAATRRDWRNAQEDASRGGGNLLRKFPNYSRKPIPIGYVQLPQFFEVSQGRLRLRGVVSPVFKPCYERLLVRDEFFASSDVLLRLL